MKHNETERGFSLSALWSYLYGMGALSPKTCEILFEQKILEASLIKSVSTYLAPIFFLSSLNLFLRPPTITNSIVQRKVVFTMNRIIVSLTVVQAAWACTHIETQCLVVTVSSSSTASIWTCNLSFSSIVLVAAVWFIWIFTGPSNIGSLLMLPPAFTIFLPLASSWIIVWICWVETTPVPLVLSLLSSVILTTKEIESTTAINLS